MNGSEMDEQASHAHEPTTMRLPGISDLEQVDTSAEVEVSLSKADQATVNRERIDEATLHTGDEVQIGKFRLVFYAGRA
jgi:hypothetical protein